MTGDNLYVNHLIYPQRVEALVKHSEKLMFILASPRSDGVWE